MRTLALLAVLACARPAAAYDFIDYAEPFPLDFVQGGAAVAGAGNRIYWLDERKGLLHVLSADGRPLASAGSGKLKNPEGLAVTPAGEVYVADTGNSRIVVFDRDGKELRVIGERGSDPGYLSKPRSVAVGFDGRVWVSDSGNERVQVFTSEGVFLFGFGGSGKENGLFNDNGRIAVDAMDNVFVLDEGNERVQKFDARTKHVKNFQLHGTDFALDDYGYLYMIDPKRSKVKEVGPDGIVLGGFGTEGKNKGQFRKAGGIGVDEHGTVLIADVGNKRLQRVKLQNKSKTERVRMNLETKLLVTGPTRVLPAAASVIAAAGDEVFAWIPKGRQVQVYKGKDLARSIGGPEVKGEAAMRSARGLVASSKWGLFVSDAGGDKILSFGLTGEHKTNIGATEGFFASKKKEGRVKAPAGLAINEKGTLYLADAGNKRVDAFGPDGSFLFSFGPVVGPYELVNPVSVAWDEAGFLYVLDTGLKKVLKCEPSGGYVKSWGEEGEQVGQFDDPVALVYDGRAYVYVLDRGHKRVSVFDREGRWVTNFFSGGQGERNLAEPESLAVLGSELLIADPSRQRVAAFALRPRLAPPPMVSTKTVEGEVLLSWDASADPWAVKYRVERATNTAGPWKEAGPAVSKPAFKEANVEAYQTYFYRVAVEAGTGDVGPTSRPVEVFVPGSFNVAPVEISTVTLGNIFSANYKWYLRNPLGKAVLVNNLNVPFQNVKVSFRLKDFMDFATESVVEKLGPKEKVEVNLVATLNNKILDVSEDTPIQAEIMLTYFEKGQKREFSLAVPLRVYSRRAITWQDSRRVANFITPNDPPVDMFKSEVLRDPVKTPKGVGRLNKAVVTAARLWSALGSVGVRFLPAANNPFELMSEDPAFPVDYTQFPRDTLEKKSGECDDLVNLFAALLENASVPSAVLDYPGHLAFMFDTGATDARDAGLSEDLLISYEGTLWVPVEATMVGQPFLEAVRKAAFAYKEMAAAGKATVVDPRLAWKTYEPATLPKPEQGAPALDAADLKKRFEEVAVDLLAFRYKSLAAEIKARMEADGESAPLWNQRGLLDAQFGKPSDAEKAFRRAIELDATSASAHNNLGSLAYQAGRYAEALASYRKASAADPEDAGVWLNVARALLKLGKAEEAKEPARMAAALDPGLKEQAQSLLKL